MTALTGLGLAEARDGLRAKKFSARELAEAHVKAVEAARPLNYDRPWAPRIVHAAGAGSQETPGNAAAPPSAHSPPPRDATPASEELQADD